MRSSSTWVVLVAIFLVSAPFNAIAQSPLQHGVVAKVFALDGGASALRAGAVVTLAEGTEIQAGDEVRVESPGRVALQLADGSYVRLASGSRMRFPAPEAKLGLISGALHFFSHSERHPTIETEQVTAAIRGTEFNLVVQPSVTVISMLSGRVDGASPGGSASLGAGQGARFYRSKAPEIYALVASDKSAQWTLFVPALDVLRDLTSGGATLSDSDRGAIEAATKARGSAHYAKLRDSLAVGAECSARSVAQARLLISDGAPDAAKVILEACLSSNAPSSARGAAAATLALTSLASGDLERAEQLAAMAHDAAPQAPSVALARSFVLQSRGSIEGALAALESEGVVNDDTIVARRAELLFALGRVPEARKLLAEIPSRSWYADAVYGFVLMGDRELSQAREAFDRALAAEPSAGLPQLGLGLALFSSGETEAAKQAFERAVALEPSSGTFRSYLAKSYFETDTYSLAEPEFARAMEIDPNDPTPYLYRSFMRVAQNEPVSALHDLEKAADLSNARSVYRSRFLLDEDSAVQSASLARVFRDLGFLERGKVEAISAITSNYTNASAHRFLSEVQENVFLADSSLSERRISNLFAPLSINLADSIGTSASLNEYSALFERDGWRTGLSTLYDSRSDQFVSGVFSANKSGNVVTGLSATGIMQDGLADSPRYGEGRFGASFNIQPTWADRILLEARGSTARDSQVADDVDFDGGSVDAAYLHRFSPQVTGIVQTRFERSREKLARDQLDIALNSTQIGIDSDDSVVIPAIINSRSTTYDSIWTSEAQLVAQHERLTSISTLRVFTSDFNAYDDSVMLADELDELTGLDVPLASRGPVNLSGVSGAYLGDLRASDALHLNFGGAYESIEWAARTEPPFDSNSESSTLWSPRGGIIYRPDSSMLMRIGYGESLGKGSQRAFASIEPTLIGGITQRFNDLPGTRARNFGTGLDLHPRQSTYLGAEWTRRWLSEPDTPSIYKFTVDFTTDQNFSSVDQTERVNSPLQQDFISAYLNEVIDDHWVLGSSYRFARENFQSRSLLDGDFETRDHRGKFYSRYFWPTGFFVQGSGTYVYQDSLGVAGEGEAGDCGWLFGAGVGYRLPTRQGLVLAEVVNILGQNFALNQVNYFNDPIVSDPYVLLSAQVNF